MTKNDNFLLNWGWSHHHHHISQHYGKNTTYMLSDYYVVRWGVGGSPYFENWPCLSFCGAREHSKRTSFLTGKAISSQFVVGSPTVCYKSGTSFISKQSIHIGFLAKRNSKSFKLWIDLKGEMGIHKREAPPSPFWLISVSKSKLSF